MPQTLTEPNLKPIKANADKHAEGLVAPIGIVATLNERSCRPHWEYLVATRP